MEYKVSWAVCTGRRHRIENIPCQDWVTVRREEALVCCALADGAGSRSHSALGAECVTRTMAELLSGRFEELWAMEPAPLAETVIGRCVQALNSLEPPIYDLACTLLFCAAHRDGRFLAGHLGDGVMILEAKGNLSVFSPPENGAYQNETYFITGADAVHHLRLQRGQWPEEGALLMMSDGTADSLYHYADGIPAAACRTLAEWLREGEEETVSQAIQDNLEQTFANRTSDDMSLILLSWQGDSAFSEEIPPEKAEGSLSGDGEAGQAADILLGGADLNREAQPQGVEAPLWDGDAPTQEAISDGIQYSLTERGDAWHESGMDRPL